MQYIMQVAKEQQALIQERSNVLSDMISVQACVMELLQKHWSWMYGMAPAEAAAEPASTTQTTANSGGEQQSLLHQNQYRQHTCLRQLQSATPQQLQQALKMTSAEW
jgi:hypothetical protein